jgi:hypothetical protein
MTSTSSSMDILIGKKLVLVTFIHNYIQLGFEDTSRLTVLNAYTCSDRLEAMIWSTVAGVEFTTEKLLITFDAGAKTPDGAWLNVGLLDDDWFGPEAFWFNEANQPVGFIWRCVEKERGDTAR